ncbi:hypothetical protein BDZ89DRAFT_1166791 [Hymenopellis radicata]|nr:hypothetical protein BDZ89DRAFT_1166791 [Hymenopellis radicata]
MEVLTEDELNKLTGTQLKAFCKDRKIPRYSKAKKAELLQMALDYQNARKTAQPAPSEPTTVGAPVIASTPAPARKQQHHAPYPNRVSSSDPQDLSDSPHSDLVLLSPPASRQISLLSAPSIATESSQPLSQYSFSSQLPLSQVRAPSVATQTASTSTSALDLPQPRPTAAKPPSAKKRKAEPENNVQTKKVKPNADPKPTACKPKAIPFKMPNKPVAVAPKPLSAIPSASTPSSLLPAMPHPPARTSLISTTTNAKRFTPLVVKKPPPPTKVNQDTMTLSQQGRSQIYLDFITTLPVSLDNISLPPSLASRKLVPRYALFLSQVAEEDLKSCTLVSKMFRYAAYISASYRLLHDFSGYRFGLVLQTYPQNMTNMWPYLRQRRAELAERRSKYKASFLSTAFGGREMIASQLWMSPDHDKQITIAIRFLLTRLFFCVSVGQPSEWIDGQIVHVQQLVDGEIWCVTMERNSSRESFYVLEATCEVVGRVEDSSSKADDYQRIPVRADWSDYIAHRLSPPTVHTIPPPPLMEQVSWTNHEEYERGISRHWLKRIRREGSLGAVKEVIAERYILACVVANSLSGKWKSSTEMAQDFAGLDSVPIHSAKPRSTKVNLFLPAHHHVESIHFQTQSVATLHPALAIVQTSNREYFILKDNGMQVGSEEEGVAAVWMQLLSCTNSGESL